MALHTKFTFSECLCARAKLSTVRFGAPCRTAWILGPLVFDSPLTRTGGTNVTRAFFKLITSVCRERLVPARQNREKTPQSKASTAPRLIGVGTSSLNLQMRSPAPYNIFKARIKNKSPFHALLRMNDK